MSRRSLLRVSQISCFYKISEIYLKQISFFIISICFINRHLDGFGLPQEFGTYGKIRGLSGGQKVKLVLAAAFWTVPHLVVLDEPTNFLDREALGSLSSGLNVWGGAVIMISHNR